jgi:hypothetical protein
LPSGRGAREHHRQRGLALLARVAAQIVVVQLNQALAWGVSLARIPWSDALDRVTDGFKRIVDRDGPDAVAFYLSGQLLTEDYYVANKLMKGFIGSANVDTNSRL